jgi:hypothetical protein
VNPNSVQFVMRPQLSGQELAQFKGRLSSLLAVRPGAAKASKVQSAEAAGPGPKKL